MKYHDDTIIEVTLEIYSSQLFANQMQGHGSWIYPIELCKYWLEKFGFTWSGGDHYEKDGLWVEDCKGGYRICRPVVSEVFKTLHELQNNHFRLLKKELKLEVCDATKLNSDQEPTT